jgi:hypothetical protein
MTILFAALAATGHLATRLVDEIGLGGDQVLYAPGERRKFERARPGPGISLFNAGGSFPRFRNSGNVEVPPSLDFPLND